jgi:hypothetical protein
MTVSLLVCTKKEERFVECFLGAEGMQNAAFHACLCASCGDSDLSCRNVYVEENLDKCF